MRSSKAATWRSEGPAEWPDNPSMCIQLRELGPVIASSGCRLEPGFRSCMTPCVWEQVRRIAISGDVIIDTCRVTTSSGEASPWRRLAEAGVLLVAGACVAQLLPRRRKPSDRVEVAESRRLVLTEIERVNQTIGGLERRHEMAEFRRAEADRHHRRRNVLVATLAFTLSAGAGVALFFPSMANLPTASDPGRIGVALLRQASPRVLQASVRIDGSAPDSMAFTLAVSDFSGDRSKGPFEVAIYACGRVAAGLVMQEMNGGKILEMKPIDGSRIEFDSRLGERSECTYTVASTPDFQVLLAARSMARLASTSGDGILYALPALTTLFQEEPLGQDVATPLAEDSTLSVSLDNVRSDFNLSASAPQVPDSGQFAWTTSVNPRTAIPSQYRISGTLAAERNRIQAGIFAAGALAGLAGAALLWLIESVIALWQWRRAGLPLEVGFSEPP